MRVLVVYYGDKNTFIQRDISILSKHYEVEEIGIRKMRLDVFSLIKKIKWSDIIFIWFAANHAGVSVLLSKILRRKSVVVVGGYDVANVPEIKYGLWYSGRFMDKFLCKYSIKNADFVIPVSKFHKNEMLKIAKPKKYKVVYNGVPVRHCIGEKIEKEKKILTVGILIRNNIKRKGLFTYLEVAKRFPEYEFFVVGKEIDDTIQILKKHAPPNAKILGFLSENQLKKIYQQSSIYLQLSAYESFGVALVEAMSCGCIPVVTNRGALPEVVDDAGVIVEYGNIKNIVEGVKIALKLSEDKEFIEKVKERAKYFSLEKRELELVKIIESIK